MKRVLSIIVGVVAGLVIAASCVGVNGAGASGGGVGGIVAIFAADVDGDGEMSPEEMNESDASDFTNVAGMACPAGFTYIGYTVGYEPLCAR